MKEHSAGRSVEAASERTENSEQLEPILERLPPESKAEIVEYMARTSHSGPLPAPDDLEEYERILPGLAERIMMLTEKEQAHRHETITSVFKREANLKDRGQHYGMIALVLMLVFCGVLAVTGSPQIAGWVAGGVIMGVVGIFVTGKTVELKAKSSEELESDK